MHKCPNCGQEFEGKFCPDCGAQWQEEKTCPKCGAKLSGSARFCNECGYSFTGTTNTSSEPKEKQPSSIKQKLSTTGTWIKSHIKIVVPIALGIVVLIVLLSLIPTFIAMKTNGTYYGYRNGEFDDDNYFTLSGGKWSDNDGETGTYKIDGENIIFYVEFFGSTEELANGTISNGVIALDVGGGIKEIYVKKEHKHEYGEWHTVREADCITDGLKTRTCACGNIERDETPRWGHTGEWIILKDATCTEEGNKKINCSVCGEEITETIEKTPHTFNEWTEIKEATCTEEGQKTRTCSACGNEETEIIGKISHTYEVNYKYDTNNHWQSCTVCENKSETEAHDNKDDCSVCGYPFEFVLNNNDTYSLKRLDSSYTKDEIVIPSSHKNLPVSIICDYAFQGRTSLTSVTIPDSITEIGQRVFFGCSLLESVTIGNSVSYIHISAFQNCTSLKQFTVSEDNVYYSSQDGVLYNKSKTSFKFVPPCISGNVTIPNGISSITNDEFYHCTSLTSITIPDSVKSIGARAFQGCSSLTNATILGCITSISGYAFYNCTSLTSITIPDSVTQIDIRAFYGCSSLTNITIPDGVTTIAEYAFCGCSSLTSINIPDGVTQIREGTFTGCSSLTNINFKGTVSEWNAIGKGSLWNYNTGDYTIYCTDGEIDKDGTVTMY